MKLTSIEIIALISSQLKAFHPDADRIAELAAALKEARKREAAEQRIRTTQPI
jgi:hypothetical protein